MPFNENLHENRNQFTDWFGSQLTDFIMIRFFLKGVTEQTSVITTVNNCKFVLVLYNVNSTDQWH